MLDLIYSLPFVKQVLYHHPCLYFMVLACMFFIFYRQGGGVTRDKTGKDKALLCFSMFHVIRKGKPFFINLVGKKL